MRASHPCLSNPRCSFEWAGTPPRERCFGWAPFRLFGFRDFHTHGPRMRIDDLSAPSGRFAARVTAAVTTDGCRPVCGDFFPAADNAFASVFAVPSGGGTGSAEAPAAVTSVAQHPPPTSGISQGVDSAEITDPTASVPSTQGDPAPPTALPPSGRISTRTHRRTAAAAGAEPPSVDYGFGPVGAPRPSARRTITPPRVPRP